MLVYCFLLLFFSVVTCIAQENPPEEHKFIVLISTPRSLSTVFYRMMEARGDCAVLCEPGVDAYTLSYIPEFADAICDPYSAKTFEDTEKKILSVLNDNEIVFVKEMGFAAREYLLKNRLREIVLHDAYCIFLIRDPHQAMISFYKKFPESFAQLADWLGYDKLYEFYEEIKRQSCRKPFIIVVDELSANPRMIVENFCLYSQIPFDEKQLNWTSLANAMPDNHVWNNEASLYWFDKAVQSTTFDAITTYALDDESKPTFEEISNPEHRALYKDLYEKNLIYYKKFIEAHHE